MGGSKKISSDLIGEWFRETKQRIPEKERIFLVGPEDKRLRQVKSAIREVFGSKFQVVTADSLRSLEDLCSGICNRIRESCFVIVIYAKCLLEKEGSELRLPRDNIPFELGVCYGMGVPVMLFRDADIERQEMENEFSDIKGRWCETLKLRSPVQMKKKLKSEYEKLKPQLVAWLVSQYQPPDSQKIPKAKRERMNESLMRLAEDVVRIPEDGGGRSEIR